MSFSPPERLLFLHPDAYGDLFLFEPVPRLIRRFWPQTEVAVLIREPYADAGPLLASEGVRFLTTTCNPYREAPGANPAALDALRDTVRAFAPDCVVAACTEQTWLEAAVGAFLPGVRQVSLGPGLTDPLSRAALENVLPVNWATIYPERLAVETEGNEWDKNLRLAGALLGEEAPRWWPLARVPENAREQASQIIREAGLRTGEYVVCPAAGTANVAIKSWPAENYGETIAWLERERGLRTLLTGHASEGAVLEIVRETARRHGAEPALWVGQDGEMPVLAGLLEAARFYFGNDTGALHLAAALGKPVVPVFGGGHWPRFQPVARRSLTVVQPLPCFGCAWDCFYADAPCVRTISPASVRRALEQFLQDEADGQSIFRAEGLDPGARALIDAATPRLRFQREDSANRLHQVQELTVLLQTSEADRDARQAQVQELTTLLQASEADREARQAQVQELTVLLQTSEADRDARQAQVQELTVLLQTSEADRDARQAQVQELTTLLQASEADREARGKQVAELLPLLRASEADRDARYNQVQQLTVLLEASGADRDKRGEQVAELLPLLRASEADRDARYDQVQQLTVLLEASEADRDKRGEQVAELLPLLRASEADREARQIQVQELTALLKTSEVDRDARYAQIQQLTAWLKESEADRDARYGQVQELTALLKASETDRERSQPSDESPFRSDAFEASQDLPGKPVEKEAPETILPTDFEETDGPKQPKAKLTPTPVSGTP